MYNLRNKKLYRSKNDRMVAGIVGGFGDYLSVDSTVLRVLFLLLLFITGVFPLILFYIVAIFIIPNEGKNTPPTPHQS